MGDADTREILTRLETRLGLVPSGEASDADLERLQRAVDVSLPSLLAAFLRRFDGCEDHDLVHDTDSVLLHPVSKIILEIEMSEVEGTGAIPFAYDMFGGLWFLMLRESQLGPAGRVEYMAVQDRYIDPEQPLERRAESFEAFLEGLQRAPK